MRCVVEALLRREEGMKLRDSGLLLLAQASRSLFRVGVLATLLMTLLYASEAWAETFTVTNLNDSGPGSLRKTINDAA